MLSVALNYFERTLQFILSLKVKKASNQAPINGKVSAGEDTTDDAASRPVSDRMAAWKQNVDTPNKPKSVDDPTQLPISERFAGEILDISCKTSILH